MVFFCEACERPISGVETHRLRMAISTQLVYSLWLPSRLSSLDFYLDWSCTAFMNSFNHCEFICATDLLCPETHSLNSLHYHRFLQMLFPLSTKFGGRTKPVYGFIFSAYWRVGSTVLTAIDCRVELVWQGVRDAFSTGKSQ